MMYNASAGAQGTAARSSAISEAPKPVSEAIRLGMLAPLVAACAYAAVLLIPFAGHTDAGFAWSMAAPTAWLLGSRYAGSGVMMVLTLRTTRWVDARVSVYSTSIFIPLILVDCLLGRHTSHLTGGRIIAFFAAWSWMLIRVAAVFIGVGVLLARWRTPGRRIPRAPGLPLLVGGPMSATTAGCATTRRPG